MVCRCGLWPAVAAMAAALTGFGHIAVADQAGSAAVATPAVAPAIKPPGSLAMDGMAPAVSTVAAAAAPLIARLEPAGTAADPAVRRLLARGENPWPVHLRRPPPAPLSAMALLGRQIFHDASLSGSGKLACASCHQPTHHYGPPDAAPAAFGGTALTRQGVRAVPSLTYLERQPGFSIGPDDSEAEGGDAAQMLTHGLAQSSTTPRLSKTAASVAQSAAAAVPQGGLFWDGRADTLQDQALTPLLDPLEMAGGSVTNVAARLHRPDYVGQFTALFGKSVLENPGLLLAEAMFAVARYQIEEPAFHAYSSKFDAWLEGKVRLSPAETRGYLLFNDPDRANCAGCHLDRASPDGTPPLFTDHQFEALGVPRNRALQANADASYFDLGLCGPYRQDLHAEPHYCGMFLTPTLRNVAARQVFFHNGVYHTLRQVMDFYALRDVAPQKLYPRGPDGSVVKYDDLPPTLRGNVDVTDAPFNRMPGHPPPMTGAEERDIIAFLRTLTDGYPLNHEPRR